MPIGPLVRQMLGLHLKTPYPIFTGGIFIDLETLVQQIHKWTPSASSIFEFGCGEGAVVEILTQTFPLSHITGIDISPRIGRMYQGDTQRVVFKQQDIKDFAAENPASFDLIIINDVMHHIPWDMHEPILEYVKSALKSGGHLILKDWNRNYSPIYFICYFMDRFITGDRVRYKTTLELQDLLRSIFGVESIKSEATIRPWSNNIAFLIQK